MLFEQTPKTLQFLGASVKVIWVSLPEHFSIGCDQPDRRPTPDAVILMIVISLIPQDRMSQLPPSTRSIRFVKGCEFPARHFDKGQALFSKFFFPLDQVVA